MAVFSNFTQAMKELTGFDDESVNDDVSLDTEENNVNVSSINHSREKNITKNADKINSDMEFKDEAKDRKVKMATHKVHISMDLPNAEQMNGSIISSNMIINGNIEGADSLKIDGNVVGNVKISASAIVSGKIKGNVEINSMSMDGAIKGNVIADGDINIYEKAIVIGDVQSKNIAIEGRVKGNLKVKESTEVAESALIAGDITTSDFISDKGCAIMGSVTTNDSMKYNFDEDKLFNIGE